MQAPTRGANGDKVTKDRPLYPFPTNIAMKSSTALADAQIGRRTYPMKIGMFSKNFIFFSAQMMRKRGNMFEMHGVN
jgi:hypothetical protein